LDISTGNLRRKTSSEIIEASRYAIPSRNQYGLGFWYTQVFITNIAGSRFSAHAGFVRPSFAR
jgi:hypothetical protein